MAMTGGKAYKVLSKHPNYGNASWTIDLYVYVVIGSYNIVANTTPLKLGMYLVTPGSAYDVDWGDIYGSYLGISEYQGGAEQKNAFSKGVTGGGTIWIAENKSVTVSHASDGTAKAVPIQWKFGVYSDWGGYTNPSGGFTIELPTIPRVSDVSTTSTGVIGSALTISINRKSSAFTHTLKYKFKGASGTIVSGTSATSISWTPPMSLCTQIPNANSESCTITCETYSGSTLIGTSECSIRLSVPSSVQLTLSSGWAAVSPYNTGTAASGISKYVQGYSKAEVTFDNSKISTGDSYGAGISSFQVLFGGKSIVSTPYRTPVLSTAGTMNLECQVTDTRGRTQSVVLSVLVQPYTQPLLSDVSVFRCNAAGEADDAGTFISVYAKPNYSTVDGENTAALTVRYKTEGGSYGSTLQIAGETTSVIGDGLVMVEQSYLVEITITDTIGNKNLVTVQIPTERVFFEGYRDESNGAAFGKHVTLPDYLDLEWNLRTRKNLVVDGATTLATALGIGSGGTGEKSRYGAINGLIYLGANPVTSDTDTTAYWGQTLGNGVAMFSQTGCVADQPSQYGFIINCCIKGSSEVHQIWLTQSTGAMYHRGGNSSGWNGSWRKVLDNTMTIPVSGGGTDATTAAGARKNLGIDTSVLYSGSLSSGSASFTFGSHKAFIVVGKPASSAASVALVIPAKFFNSVARSMQLADNVDFIKFTIKHTDASGSLTITQNDNSGVILAIYGVN